MNESVYAHILWQIERGLRYPMVRSSQGRVTWLTDTPLSVPENELLNKMALAMRLPVGVTQIHSGRSLDNLQATDLLIVLGLSTAEALKLPQVEPGKVQWTTDVTSPILLTHHPRELLAEPALKRQSWTQLQVAMAYLNL